jgi:hypothetical protein
MNGKNGKTNILFSFVVKMRNLVKTNKFRNLQFKREPTL